MALKIIAAFALSLSLCAQSVQPAAGVSLNFKAQDSRQVFAIPSKQIPPRYMGTQSGKSQPVFYGNYQDWYHYVMPRFKKGLKYRVIDFDTKLSYFVIRVGGNNHADVEPATAADTKTMYQTLGNTWKNWRRRALIVIIDNEPIAASLYGEPHAYETIPNNGMRGQVCIHFRNSKTHGSNRVDPDHQYQVRRAAGIVK